MKLENKRAQIPVCPLKVPIATTIVCPLVVEKNIIAMEE